MLILQMIKFLKVLVISKLFYYLKYYLQLDVNLLNFELLAPIFICFHLLHNSIISMHLSVLMHGCTKCFLVDLGVDCPSKK